MDENTYDVEVLTPGATPGTVVIRYKEDLGNLAYVRDLLAILLGHLGETVSITIRGNRFQSCPALVDLN